MNPKLSELIDRFVYLRREAKALHAICNETKSIGCLFRRKNEDGLNFFELTEELEETLTRIELLNEAEKIKEKKEHE